MTAKVLATLGALGLILSIWTADWRFLWTGLLALIISIGIAATQDTKRKDPRMAWAKEVRELKAENEQLREQPGQLSKPTRDALKIFEGLAIEEPAPWIEYAAMFAASGATDQQIRRFAQIIGTGQIGQSDLNHLEESGINLEFKGGQK